MEKFPSMMMLFGFFPAFWWTCGAENTGISVKCESYFSAWLNWSHGGFCVQSIRLMGLLLLAVPKSTTNIYCAHCMWNSALDSTSKCLKSSKQRVHFCSLPKAGGGLSLRLCMAFVSCLHLIPSCLRLLEHLPQRLLLLVINPWLFSSLPLLTEMRKRFLETLMFV